MIADQHDLLLKGQRSSLTLGTLTIISSKYNGFGFNRNWPSLNVTCLLVMEKKILKGLNHIWAWPPSWSCDLNHLHNFLFPYPKKSSYERTSDSFLEFNLAKF